jgi:23S rRNA pseudouridine1911/1915/1917 synthase
MVSPSSAPDRGSLPLRLLRAASASRGVGQRTGELMAQEAECSELTLPAAQAGRRLDVVLAALLPDRSRSFLSRLLKDGAILLDGRQAKPSHKVHGGEKVEIEWPAPEVIEARAENIPLAVIYEDGDLIAINKPAGMCSHPSAGHTTGTLVNALLGHCRDLSGINGALRPGIVHRLDAETSGVILVAKNDLAHQALQDQFMARRIHKQYLALCHGAPPQDQFTSEGRIGRHPTRRLEMTVLRGPDEGREARTDFEVLQRFDASAWNASPDERRQFQSGLFMVLARPHTGRTHQIRVHLAKAGYPVLADRLYGPESEIPALHLARHALHAWKIEFDHPRTAKTLLLEAPLADDMKSAVAALGGRWPL